MQDGVAQAARKGVCFEVHCEMDEHLVYSQKLKLPKGSLIVHATHFRRLAEHLKKSGKLRSILATQIHDVIAHNLSPIAQVLDADDPDNCADAIDARGWEWGQTEPTLRLAVHHFKDDGFTWVKLAPTDLKTPERESEGLYPVAAPRPRDWFCPGQRRDGGRCGFRNNYDDNKCRSKRGCYVKKNLINVASVMMPGEEDYFSRWICSKCDAVSTNSQCCDVPAEFCAPHVIDGFIEQGNPDEKVGRLVTIDGRLIEFDFQPYQWFLSGEKVRFNNPFKYPDEPHFRVRSVKGNEDFPMECDAIVSHITSDATMATVTRIHTTHLGAPVDTPFGCDLPLLLCDDSVKHSVGDALNHIFVFKDDRTARFFLCISKEEKVITLLLDIRRLELDRTSTQASCSADNMQPLAVHGEASSHNSLAVHGVAFSLAVNEPIDDCARSSVVVPCNATDPIADMQPLGTQNPSEEALEGQKNVVNKSQYEAPSHRETDPDAALKLHSPMCAPSLDSGPPATPQGEQRENDELRGRQQGQIDGKNTQQHQVAESLPKPDNEYVVRPPATGLRWSVKNLEPHPWIVPVARVREREEWAERQPKPLRNGRSRHASTGPKDIWQHKSRGALSLVTELRGEEILSALLKYSPAGKVIDTVDLHAKNLTPRTAMEIFRHLASAMSIKSIRIYDNPDIGRLKELVEALGPTLWNQVDEWHLTGCKLVNADVVQFLRMFEGTHKKTAKKVKFIRLDHGCFRQEEIRRYTDQCLWICDANRMTCPTNYVCEKNCDVHILHWGSTY
eukprot:GEMP01001124.1.p2 GENE.GEMP01001124.1~~GEMP01001124.1.p2  ORF type:complete len:786 (+),score=190.16 GEMP01001124.1:2569-4926(+)